MTDAPAQIIHEVGWNLRKEITTEAYERDMAYADDITLPVHQWHGEDREGKAMTVSWVVGFTGHLLSAYEIQERA